MELVAHLADQDISRDDALAAKPLDTTPLSIRIPPVAARPLTLLMRHLTYLNTRDHKLKLGYALFQGQRLETTDPHSTSPALLPVDPGMINPFVNAVFLGLAFGVSQIGSRARAGRAGRLAARSSVAASCR